MRHPLLLTGTIAASFLLAAALPAAPTRTPEQVAMAALAAAPVWDGHNDVPEQLRDRRKDVLGNFDFTDTTNTADPATGTAAMQTDLKRLRKGHVGAQFWSVYVSASLPDAEAAVAAVEQIDVMKRLIARYPDRLTLATNADQVEAAMARGRVASLLGMEGGNSIAGSLAAQVATRGGGVIAVTRASAGVSMLSAIAASFAR